MTDKIYLEKLDIDSIEDVTRYLKECNPTYPELVYLYALSLRRNLSTFETIKEALAMYVIEHKEDFICNDMI